MFYGACGVLLLLSGLFLLLPRRSVDSVPDDTRRANREWYELRQAEIIRDGDQRLEADVGVRLLEDEQQGSPGPKTPAEAGTQSFALWVLPVFVVVASGVLYHLLGAAPDVAISRQLQALGEAPPEEQLDELLSAIEERAAQRPENLHYIALLGQFYMGRQDYARAAIAYKELATEAPGDAQALAYASQAQYLASGRKLTDEARMLGEQALAVNPHQKTALGLLGMASFEQGQYRAAIEYWQRLVAIEPAGSETARMIGGVIETARQRLAAAGGEAPQIAAAGDRGTPHVAARGLAAPDAAAPDADSLGVTVRVAFPDGAAVTAADTVFVLARSAASDSRMPVAVQRLQASQLPVTLRLDDRSSMAGQKLSQLASIMVFVQVSPDGRPGEGAATWLGSAGPLAPSLAVEPLEITLSPRG